MPRVPAQPPVIQLRLQDSVGNPLANTTYAFAWREVQGGHRASQTDSDGVLIEPIPFGAKTATLTLADPVWSVVVTLASYSLPPDASGTAARLNNLQLMALAPSTQLSASDPEATSLAFQRYKSLKHIDLKKTLDEVATVLAADHDNI